MAKDANAGLAPLGISLGAARRRAALAVILLSSISTTMVFVTLTPIANKIAVHFGGGANGEFSAEMGITMASLGIMIGGLASGWLIERIGLRRLLLLAIAFYGLSGVAGGLFSDLWAFLVTRLTLGFSVACFATAALTLLSEIYDEGRRTQMIGFWSGAGGFGAVVIMYLSGVAAQAFGWQSSFLLYGAVSAPSLVLAFFAIPADARVDIPHTEAVSTGKIGMARILPVLLLILPLQVLLISSSVQLPFVLAAKGMTSPQQIGLVIGLATPLCGVAAMLSGYLQRRFGEASVLRAGVAIAGTATLVIGLSPTALGAGIANGAMAIGVGLYSPLYFSLVLNRSSASGRSKAVGLVQSFAYLGVFLNPPILAPVIRSVGLIETFVLLGSLALGLAVLTSLWAAVRPRPAAMQAE